MANLSSQYQSHLPRKHRKLLPTEPPDPQSFSEQETPSAHSKPSRDPDPEPPTSWLERLVLIVAVVLLLIAAINIGIATYFLEPHREQPEMSQ
jgi:hypothetical protein